MTERWATSAMATKVASLIGLAPPRRGALRRAHRRDWFRREIAKADAQLKSIEDHFRAQQARVAELERIGADATDARAFLAILEDCQRTHETHRLHLVRELAAI